MFSFNKMFSGRRPDLIPFDAQALGTAAGATDSSIVINLKNIRPNGFFSVQVTTTSAGAGVLQLQYKVSIDGVLYRVPKDKDGVEADDIVTAHAVGTDIYPIGPVLGNYLMLTVTATVADLTAVTTQLLIQ